MMAAAKQRAEICPICRGRGEIDADVCRNCKGIGLVKVPADDVTLQGDASEVDYQQTPLDRARILAASQKLERENLERLRREYEREMRLWRGLQWFVCAVVVLALAALAWAVSR